MERGREEEREGVCKCVQGGMVVMNSPSLSLSGW